MRAHALSMLLCSLFLYACAEPGINSYQERKGRIGISRQQLIDELGQPEVELHTTQEGEPQSTALVYRNHPEGMDCVDAYLIDSISGIVIDYFCR